MKVISCRMFYDINVDAAWLLYDKTLWLFNDKINIVLNIKVT